MLVSAEDGYGGRYGLVWDRHTGCLTATVLVTPASPWLADAGDADAWVAGWGAWLAGLGFLPQVRWVTVAVETAPEPGTRLADAVAAAASPDAPEAARQIMTAVAAAAPHAAAAVSTRVSITFDPKADPSRPGDLAAAAAAVTRTLQGLVPGLGACGVAVDRLAGPADLAGMVRCAYDPSARGEVARLLAAARAGHGPMPLTWLDAGPVGAQEMSDCYQHDSGVSVSWAWHEAPRQAVTSSVLARLASRPYTEAAVAAVPADARRRGRPVDRGRGQRHRVPGGVQAQDRPRRHRPRRLRHRARRAGRRRGGRRRAVVLIGLFVTVTVTDAGDLPRAVSATEARRRGQPHPAAPHVQQPGRRVRREPAVRRLPARAGPQVAPVTRRPPAPPAARPDGGEPLAPAWGWRRPGGCRAAHVAAGAAVPGHQRPGVRPVPVHRRDRVAAGRAPPSAGTSLDGEVVCLDPLSWMRAGLITNPGMFVLGQPGVGKSTLVKRIAVGAVARGDTVLVLGDPRPDYAALTKHLGGQVIRIGRGADRLNPLDTGPLGAILPRLPAAEQAQVRAEARARRLALLMALCALVRGQPLANAEEVVLGAAIDLLDARHRGTPVIPDVLRVIDEGPDALRTAARADGPDRYRALTAPLAYTLDLLLTGTLAGAFDAATTRPIDVTAPMVCVDISRASGAGDKLLTAAMLCTWAAGFAVADAAGLLADAGLPGRRSYLTVLDELWRALRGAPGLVEHADALTRLNRAKGMASIMITHSLADLDSLPTEEDRSKARGFIERSAITVLAALPPKEPPRSARSPR